MHNDLLSKLKNVIEGPEEPSAAILTPVQVKIHSKQQQEAARNDLMFLIAGNIRKSENLRIEINKENDKDIMLDKALKCIAYMTNDFVFYELNKAKLKR